MSSPLRKDRQPELTTADIAQGTRGEDRETDVRHRDQSGEQRKQPVEITSGQRGQPAARNRWRNYTAVSRR
jgi:hypothetical protein